jgi:hypothetical protein
MHRHDTGTETMTPGEGTKGSDIYREGNQGSDGVQVSLNDVVHVTMVTVVRHNEQPGDLEAGEGAHVTNAKVLFCYVVYTLSLGKKKAT